MAFRRRPALAAAWIFILFFIYLDLQVLMTGAQNKVQNIVENKEDNKNIKYNRTLDPGDTVISNEDDKGELQLLYQSNSKSDKPEKKTTTDKLSYAKLFFDNVISNNSNAFKPQEKQVLSKPSNENIQQNSNIPQAMSPLLKTLGGMIGGLASQGVMDWFSPAEKEITVSTKKGIKNSLGQMDYVPYVESKFCKKGLYENKSYTSNSMIGSKEVEAKGSCSIPVLCGFDQFYSYLEKPKASCNKMEKVGGPHSMQVYLDGWKLKTKSNIGDGYKWVCFDNGFKYDDCVVYSFGINNEWTFDDNMDKKKHCKVFAFDPTMKAQDHNRSSRISFFHLGISNYKGYLTIGGKKRLVDSYRGIVEKLRHETTTIDYLKIDIEGSEIPVFQDILDNDLNLLDNIHQIGMEIHVGKADKEGFKKAKQYWEIFHRLECLGWRFLSNDMNQVPATHFSFKGTKRSCCYEVVWIKN
ncbi:unnamed protein product [Meganyctiphanes norvegica]|uniref:Methyltransferase domain-containing protein n=1 Tax=Meganyctiphanes norvegica TaxID=48144 RepID=A0AAV2QG02_MEGNR